MVMSDSQFKAFIRVCIRDLIDAINAKTPEEKNEIIRQLLEDFQRTLED